jgi:hypothetical protein
MEPWEEEVVNFHFFSLNDVKKNKVQLIEKKNKRIIIYLNISGVLRIGL